MSFGVKDVEDLLLRKPKPLTLRVRTPEAEQSNASVPGNTGVAMREPSLRVYFIPRREPPPPPEPTEDE